MSQRPALYRSSTLALAISIFVGTPSCFLNRSAPTQELRLRQLRHRVIAFHEAYAAHDAARVHEMFLPQIRACHPLDEEAHEWIDRNDLISWTVAAIETLEPEELVDIPTCAWGSVSVEWGAQVEMHLYFRADPTRTRIFQGWVLYQGEYYLAAVDEA